MAMTIYGFKNSTYVRTVRLVFEERGAPYDLVPVDIFGENKAEAHLKRQPFGQIPAFDHDGFMLYETQAITRYLDAVLPGEGMTPADVKARALMDQAICVYDGHAYGPLATLIVERLIVPRRGGTPDEAKIEAGLPTARTAMAEFARILGERGTFGGGTISLADVHLAPGFAYIVHTDEGRDMLAAHPNLQAWWTKIDARPAMRATDPLAG